MWGEGSYFREMEVFCNERPKKEVRERKIIEKRWFRNIPKPQKMKNNRIPKFF